MTITVAHMHISVNTSAHTSLPYPFTRVKPNSQVRQTRNVDVRVLVDMQSHPVGHSTDNSFVSFIQRTNRKLFLQHL